jgi:hypothetical protein
MSVHKNEVGVGERHGAAQALCLYGVFATAGTGYLYDRSTSKRYCGIGCYPQWMVVSGFVGSIAPAIPFELAVAWPKLTVDVASALFDSAWRDHGG